MSHNQEQQEEFTTNSVTNSKDHIIIDMAPISSPSNSLSPASVIHTLDFSTLNTSKRFTLESPTISEDSISPEPACSIIANSFSTTTNSNTSVDTAEVLSTRETQNGCVDSSYDHPGNEINKSFEIVNKRILSNNEIDIMRTRYQRLIDQEKIYQEEHCRRARQYRKMRICHILKQEGVDPLPDNLEPYLRNDPWCFNDYNLPTMLLNNTTTSQQLFDSFPMICPIHENTEVDSDRNVNDITRRIIYEYKSSNEHFRHLSDYYESIYQSDLDIIS